MIDPVHHQHEWSLMDSRPLHGVEPPTTVKDWRCYGCGAKKATEHPRDTPPNHS